MHDFKLTWESSWVDFRHKVGSDVPRHKCRLCDDITQYRNIVLHTYVRIVTMAIITPSHMYVHTPMSCSATTHTHCMYKHVRTSNLNGRRQKVFEILSRNTDIKWEFLSSLLSLCSVLFD